MTSLADQVEYGARGTLGLLVPQAKYHRSLQHNLGVSNDD